MNYYNEIDPFAAEWLQNLIDAGEIPPGRIDTRSIKDVQSQDLEGFTQCHFFAGIGGWPYALRLAGWPAEVQAWTGSCPCQPFSQAGEGKGVDDERHLWPDFCRLIADRSPTVVFGEQVESRRGRNWFAGIRVDLEALGYAVGAADLCAAGAAAPHRRQRIFWVADSGQERCKREHALLRQAYGRRFSGDFLEVAGSGEASWVGNADDARRAARSQEREERQEAGVKVPATGCGADGLGNSAASGRTGCNGSGIDEQRPGARRCEIWSSDAWSDFDVLQDVEGKLRRSRRGAFPVAARIPRGVGRILPELQGLEKGARRNRVGRLKGYGNAIVPQVAAEFIGAFMELS